MATLPFSYTIGLEVHVELTTTTKMFCRCPNQPFGGEPNQNTCPVCMGLPGTLPVPNREAIRKTVLVGKALGSTIPEFSKFDRKHYFYPDLPKGYQISQYDMPLCEGGRLELLDDQGNPRVAVDFERVHLEEDAGKLMHGTAGYSHVDLNRAGVPLIEMVTKPVIHSPEDARAFMQELRLLVRTLGVSEADMEKGHMRCDVNISIQFEFEGTQVSSPITEVKNVNSTRAVERCLVVEGQRLYDEWMAGGPVRERKNKITVGWDEDTQTVQINRAKEAAKDYRYFPEPDIPPLAVYEADDLNPDHMELPELPNDRRRRYLGLGLPMSDAETIMSDASRVQAFESALADGLAAKTAANWLVNIPESKNLAGNHFNEMVKLTQEGKLNTSALREKWTAFVEAVSQAGTVEAAARALGLIQEHDESAVEAAISEVLAEQPQSVADFKEGKEKVLGFLVGQVMKKAAGKAQPQKVQELLRKALGN